MSNRISLEPSVIEANLRSYVVGDEYSQGIQPCERYASFDYCFNYFQDFKDSGRVAHLVNSEHLQAGCLQLGFYLASWGMLRGSSPLLQKSAKFYEGLIAYIASAPSELWEIDVDSYTVENIQLLVDCRRNISRALYPYGASDTLAAKIMLGVFGNVPAFDTFFKDGFGVNTFGKSALGKVRDFYEENAEVIERSRPHTIDFITGQSTNRRYTRAKIIDMIFFIQGS